MQICIIPARGGSKRIPRKNIKLFMGKPIIAYSIEAALESDCFDHVIVSTDNQEIADIANNFGATTPFLRPAQLANDYTGTLAVINHTIEWLRKNLEQPEYICTLYATAPFVQAKTLCDSFDKLKQDPSKSFCFGVTEFTFPIQRAISISKQGKIEMFQPEYFESRSQDLEKAYHDAGQFYWGKTECFQSEVRMFSEHSIPFILPSYQVQDIDTPSDWIKAEALYQAMQNSKNQQHG
jgi:pseudaminic acid cytidylyltransferase